MTEIEDLRAEVEKYRKEESDRERRNYFLDKMGSLMWLIAGNLIFFGAINLMKYIVDSWWDAGILGDDPTYYLVVVGIWSILFLQGGYRFICNLCELFEEEIILIGVHIRRFIKETREARELYRKVKEERATLPKCHLGIPPQLCKGRRCPEAVKCIELAAKTMDDEKSEKKSE